PSYTGGAVFTCSSPFSDFQSHFVIGVNYDSATPANSWIRFYCEQPSSNTIVQCFHYDFMQSILPNVWYLAIGWHDKTLNTINLQINQNAVITQAFPDGGVGTATRPLGIGGTGYGGEVFGGVIDSVGMWQKVLTAEERARLWSNGNGQEPPFSADVLTDAVTTATVNKDVTTDGAVTYAPRFGF